MSELVFPIAAVALTFWMIIPALTAASRWLLARKRAHVRSWAAFGSEATFAWLVAPTLLPVLWLTSSALHQSETARAQAACQLEHATATTCLDAVVLLGVLLVGMVGTIAVRLWRERPRALTDGVPNTHPQALRLARLVAAEPRLAPRSVRLIRHAAAPVFATGWLRPTIVVDLCFMADADDAILTAALLHEWAHVAAYDTMRDFLVRLCLSVNPVGRWLAPDFERWRQAREAQCDSEAVHLGGDPLALAEGILRAARHSHRLPCATAALCGHDLNALKLRLALLLNGAPRSAPTRGHWVLFAAAIAALLVPHLQIAGVLEHVHFEVERLAHAFF
jgi:beta-lactamase regulating signal transducer with metallopeptidase domain